MINRELIRNKVVQLTYAYYQNGNRNMENAEKELMFSLSKAYDMYNMLLALIVAITNEARRQNEIETARARREGREDPPQKFCNNKFEIQLEGNKMLQEFVESKKTTWSNEIDVVLKLLSHIEQSEIYKEYMANQEEETYDGDREVWRKIYRTLIMDNTDLDAFFEEKSIYWNDDKDIVDTFVLKTIKRFEPKNGKSQELLPEYKDYEDKEFARKLFRATILNADQYQRYMSETSRNWDFSRLAYMDVVIMQIAIAEMATFPNIPINVTINEYVEIAKAYSTPRSSGYINGMLDAIARYIIDTGKVVKAMRPARNDDAKDSGEDAGNGDDAKEKQ